MGALANELRQKLDTNYRGVPFVHHYATLEHGQSSRVYVQFEPKTDREIEALHLQPIATRRKILSTVLLTAAAIAFLGFALVGAVQVFRWFINYRW